MPSATFEILSYLFLLATLKPLGGQGLKSLDLHDFSIVAEMMEQGLHLTEDGLATIRRIAAGMNRGRNKS